MNKTKYRDFEKHNRSVLSLYNKFILDPASRLIAIPVINYTNVKPYAITLIGLLVSGISAVLFYKGHSILAAFIFQFSVILDGVDGHVARIKENGSVFGMMLDAYSDIIRVSVNILALVFWYIQEADIVILLLIFLFLNFSESFIDRELITVEKFLKKKQGISLTVTDKFFIKMKNKLGKFGLKVNLLHYQERLFCVLFVGPVFAIVKLCTIIGIILVLISFHLKIFLDVAMVKDRFVNKTQVDKQVV